MDKRLLEKLNSFLALGKKLRGANSAEQIARIACTDSQQLLNFDSCLFFAGGSLKLLAASNVSTVDATGTEATRWRQLVRTHLRTHLAAAQQQCPLQIPLPHVQGESAAPRYLQLMPIGKQGDEGCLAVIHTKPLTEQEAEVLRELAASVQQALLALRGTRRVSLRRLCARRPLILALILAAICVIPVRQSVLAPATLSAIEPRIVSARTDGVIREINIAPNAPVQSGQLLFTLDDAEVTAEIDRVQQEIALYQERLRMTRQYNFQQASAGHKLAQAETDLSIRNLDLGYQQSLLEKTRVKASASGVAIYTDPAEWIGRRIRAGEKVMEIVQPQARQIQIDLATADAIALPDNAHTVFYAESAPLAPINGQLHYHSLLTAEGENLPASYRLLATIQQDQPQIRINTRGHARVYGARVPLAYHLLRRPLASARRWIGI